MANLPIISPAEFTSEIHQTEREEFITAELENQIKGQLLNNDVYLKGKTDELALLSENHGENTEIHVTATEKNTWNNGILTAEERAKLNGTAAGAEVNQNAFSNVKAGGTVITANSKTAQVEIAAGSNVTVTGDNANKKVTITANLPSTMPPSAHNQSAATITAGTFAGNVVAPAGTDYTASRIRNIKMQSSAPTTLANGEICLVYT